MILLNAEDLIDYTGWERGKWRDILSARGDQVLTIGLGANADARFHSVGEIIRHTFSAEKRYVDRLSGREITDTSSVSAVEIEPLFAFGEQSRADLKTLLATFPSDRWNENVEFELMNKLIR